MAESVAPTARLARATRPGSEGGTTLLELLVALAVLSLLLVGMLLVWGQGLAAYLQGSETADLQQEARIVHERITAELRLAGMNPCNGIPPAGQTLGITAADATSVTVGYFPAQVNCTAPPGSGAFRNVTYAYNAGTRTVERNANGAGLQALTGRLIGTLTLDYFGCDGTSIPVPVSVADLPNVARITVTIVATETFSGGPLARRLVSSVRVRSKPCTDGL